MERSTYWNNEEVWVMEWVDRARKWVVRVREESGEEKGPLRRDGGEQWEKRVMRYPVVAPEFSNDVHRCEGWSGREKVVVRLEERKVMTNWGFGFEEKEKVSVKPEGRKKMRLFEGKS
ncbi:unnamed protein product [Dovyalis caffra]|uniref:Uncharacterized protein n=1 Tax=Dovyalis caffra TaxID=77055 RepID=A0AAV1RIZ8_9ROSI|nr:unnamed protein product [Dovyalis caffra]